MATLSNFARRHALQKDDTLTKLAIQYNCSVMDLKIFNNLSSEHALMSRTEIYVKVHSKDEIKGKIGQVFYNAEAKRECVLVFPSDHVFDESTASQLAVSQQWILGNSPKADRVRKQLIRMLSRRFKIDELVAESYLAVSDWDPIQAMEQYSMFTATIDGSGTYDCSVGQDECWQSSTRRSA